MADAKNVLLVTNSTTEGELTLIKDAFLQAKSQGLDIKLTLVHVIPNLPTSYFNIPSMVVLTERYYQEATETLTSVGGLLNVAKKDQWLITGKLHSEVRRLADKLNAHFILTSSSSIQELHKSINPFIFTRSKETSHTPVRTISSLVSI